MAADPPDDPFEGVEDLIERSPPPEREPIDPDWMYVSDLPAPLVMETTALDRDRLLHEVRRSLTATHPLEGPAIVSRLEATIFFREPGAAAPIAATCSQCGCALRVIDRPRRKRLDPAERAGLLASLTKSLQETRSDPRSLEVLARELARQDVVMPRPTRSPCPMCHYRLEWPD
jgi:hypothetical protein